MRIVSFNIQFGLGRDGRIDLSRAAGLVAPADVICLQEVDRFWRRSGMTDQAAALACLLPNRYWVYGAGLDVDASTAEAGRLVNRRRQFGNMTLSRWPILSSRCLVLPKRDSGAVFNLRTPLLDTVIAAPDGPLRVLNLHLSHVGPAERLAQIGALAALMAEAACEGGAWQGHDADAALWQCDDPAPPNPGEMILAGDFNAEPGSAEYRRLAQDLGLTDAWALAREPRDAGHTFLRDPQQGALHDQRIDYLFLTTGLRAHLRACHVDAATRVSDHQPVWASLARRG